MRIVVIGGSGHIGTFLIPRLVRAGHEVVSISRGQQSRYADDPAWQHVRQVTADRAAEDRDGTFPDRVAGLQPDVVVDLICFTLDSATALDRKSTRLNSSHANISYAVFCLQKKQTVH